MAASSLSDHPFIAKHRALIHKIGVTGGMEWFLVPLAVIDEVVERIRDGTITKFRYDPEQAGLAGKR